VIVQEFVVHASWSNGQSFELYRKYLDLFTLQATLKGFKAQNLLFPELPISDHLLAVLGQLNTKESLHHRAQLVNTFCKALVAGVADRTVGDICRTSVLIFFVPRPGDIEIESTSLECRYSLTSEDSYAVGEDCLGFLSSIALAEDKKWHHTHSDLLDAPKTKPQPRDSGSASTLRFTKPSAAHPVLTHTHSAPGVTAKPPGIPLPSPAQVAARLSLLKVPPSDDDGAPAASNPARDRGHSGPGEFRRRASNSPDSREISVARAKALCIRTGSTDWGVRSSANGGNRRNTSAEDGAK
jgi:hypothetical protein